MPNFHFRAKTKGYATKKNVGYASSFAEPIYAIKITEHVNQFEVISTGCDSVINTWLCL